VRIVLYHLALAHLVAAPARELAGGRQDESREAVDTSPLAGA
jgi:hypothetical protein